MAQVRSLMSEEQQRRNFQATTSYTPSIWGYPAEDPAPAQPSASVWARPSPSVSSLTSLTSAATLGSQGPTLATRSTSGMSLSSAPGSISPLATPIATPLSSTASGLVSNQSSVSTSPIAGSTLASHTSSSASSGPTDDELILTAIVVKNIPFAIKKEQLLDAMTQMGLPLPYAFNYHFDNGVFRGLAFANFTTPEETASVITNLNGREIGGRKLRVEYKKMLPAQERERIEREKRERRGQLEEQHT